MKTPVLRTRRLLLEPYTPADEEGFVALFQDAGVARWMGGGPATEAADRALFGRIFTKVYARYLFGVWVVRQDGRTVAHAEIKPSPTPGVDGHEIVYAVTPSAWGRGLGTEITEALLAHGFGTLGLAEVHATVDPANEASLALLGRTGFRHVRDIPEDDESTALLLTRRKTAAEGPEHRVH
ncbi:GNAT family N-acetyltransferase [Streptomyces sp. NPDC050392]|uniref:GNAT family N-acetyltransferase n=1 Tax=Streptomyces sp. NPDC050392 TaxID=3155782 RepID=UPI0034177979